MNTNSLQGSLISDLKKNKGEKCVFWIVCFFLTCFLKKIKIKLFNTFSSSFPIKGVWEMGEKNTKFDKVL